MGGAGNMREKVEKCSLYRVVVGNPEGNASASPDSKG